MSLPLVSILVPVYRVEACIERCARSVFEQTYENLEYVFVDDASDDQSIKILKCVLLDYPKRLDQVHIIRHNQNKGVAASRNTAVTSCQGEFVFHVDSDDWVEANAVELLVKKQQETNADIVTAEAIDIDNDNGNKNKHLSGGWDLDRETLLVYLLTYQVSTVLWRRLIRKRLYTDNNISCDECGRSCDDFQVFPRLVYYANMVSGIEDCIYYYNKSNQQSITNNVKNNVESQIQGLVAVKVIVAFFSDKEPYLRKIVAGMDVKNIHFRLVNNAIYRNRVGYDVFLKYMKESDCSYWHLVGWNKPLIRLLESNYFTMRLTQKICKVMERIKRVIYR